MTFLLSFVPLFLCVFALFAVCAVVGATGFEPAIFRSQSGRDTRLRYAPTPRFYTADWIRQRLALTDRHPAVGGDRPQLRSTGA